MLIGLCGNKGVGKDTAARFLIDERAYVRLAFADKLRLALANLYDIDLNLMEKFKRFGYVTVGIDLGDESLSRTFTGRHAMQRFGTEMGRKTFGEDFWIDLWYDEYTRLFQQNKNVVITDVRFPNEAAMIHDCNGYVFQINRPGYEPDGHASEEPLDDEYIDATIDNSGSLDQLRDLILAAERMHASDKQTGNPS